VKIDRVKKLEVEDRFLYWIEERESIRIKKEAGERKPWTDDEILQKYRFCNVRRMDDKVSRWLLKNWYKPYFGHPNMLMAVALARFLNLPKTLEHIRFPTRWNPESIKKQLHSFEKNNKPIWNSAYMVRGNSAKSKIDSVVDYNVQPLINVVVHPSSMKETWQSVKASYGFGSFMSGQVVADLRWAMRGTWADKKVWAAVGPGSSRGILRLMRQPAKSSMRQEEFDAEFPLVIDMFLGYAPKIYKRLESVDIQSCLCEFDKYERVLQAEGRPKQLYQGAK